MDKEQLLNFLILHYEKNIDHCRNAYRCFLYGIL